MLAGAASTKLWPQKGSESAKNEGAISSSVFALGLSAAILL
jgi:hypothetical protein